MAPPLRGEAMVFSWLAIARVVPAAAALTLAACATVPVAAPGSEPDRLWVQATPVCNPIESSRQGARVASVPAVGAAIIAGAMGEWLKAAGNRLKADSTYTITTVLPLDDAFRHQKTASARRTDAPDPAVVFAPRCVTLTVGPAAVALGDAKGPFAMPDLAGHEDYLASPVFIQIEYGASNDKTAVAPTVVHWKYARFLDPDTAPLRKPQRQITVSVEITQPSVDNTADVDVRSTFQAVGSLEDLARMSGKIERQEPPYNVSGPWQPRPSRSPPAAWPDDQSYGPVNLKATIAELSWASDFARFFAAGLGSQQSEIESLVEARIKEAVDPTARAQARLAALSTAQSARSSYATAYKAAQDASNDYCAGKAAMDAVDIALAIVRQDEDLARRAMDNAGIAFTPMPELHRPTCVPPVKP
jgi:hypothetical protein